MGKISGSYFENPYIDEEEHKPSLELVMDEARKKWRTGVWKPKEGSFELKREQLAEEDDDDRNAPSSERFKLDVKKDLMGEGISLESLRELSYTPSYRPKGTLEKLDDETFVPMSTVQRYDVLAGDLEKPPEDLSFLSDAQSRYRKVTVQKGEKKDGRLRSDSRRLERSVDSRRSEILRLLPSADEDDTLNIISESKRRKAREDRELGREPKNASVAERMGNYERIARRSKETDNKKKTRDYLAGINAGFLSDQDIKIRVEGERIENLPQQDGMEDTSRQLPQFESQTRRWSEIDAIDPTWSEIAEHTESSTPDEESGEREPRYVDEDLFDLNAPYKEILPPRKRLRSKDYGHYDTEYIREAGVDPKRIKEIMDTSYRGRWVPPEYFSDDQMVNEWFNQYNRGALSGEDYMHWAYRQKMMEYQQQQAQQLAEEQAEYAREMANRKPAYRGRSEGRRFPPFSEAVPYVPQEMSPQYLQALKEAGDEGYRHGVEIDRRERMREEERRREMERRYGGRGGYYDDRRRDDRYYERFDRSERAMGRGGRGERSRDRYPDADRGGHYREDRRYDGREERRREDYPRRRKHW